VLGHAKYSLFRVLCVLPFRRCLVRRLGHGTDLNSTVVLLNPCDCSSRALFRERCVGTNDTADHSMQFYEAGHVAQAFTTLDEFRAAAATFVSRNVALQ
jgi:hypothetical protein